MNQHPPNSTPAGEKEGLFAATHWTVVLNAKGDSLEALNSLCATYRSPLIALLVGRGEKAEQAEDSVQSFLAHLSHRDALRNVAREKGRFRSFLKTAFQNFPRDQYRRSSAAKRGGGQDLASLDDKTEGGSPALSPPAMDDAPDKAYDRAYAHALLARALQRLETESSSSGHRSLCKALEPVLFQDEEAPAYSQVAAQFGMSLASVKTAVYRIRRRLNAIIREEIAQTVSTPEELEDELRYLLGLFGRPAPGA